MSTGPALRRRPEAFPCPPGLRVVVEANVRARCPFTGAPDRYELEIEYVSTGRCVEAHSLAEWLEGFKEDIVSQEELTKAIAEELRKMLEPEFVCTRLRGSHGSVFIATESCYGRDRGAQPL